MPPESPRETDPVPTDLPGRPVPPGRPAGSGHSPIPEIRARDAGSSSESQHPERCPSSKPVAVPPCELGLSAIPRYEKKGGRERVGQPRMGKYCSSTILAGSTRSRQDRQNG